MRRTDRLVVVLAANLALVGGLMAVGLSAHSVGVLAEGVDYLADAATIGISLLAIHLARRSGTRRRPGGYPTAARHAALLNASWLLLASLVVVATAADRLVRGTHEVHGLPMLVVSGIAALVMLGGALLLGGDLDDEVAEEAATATDRAAARRASHERLSVGAVLLDTAADAAAAGGVAVTGGLIAATGGSFWLDPLVALGISLAVAFQALRLLGRVRAAG